MMEGYGDGFKITAILHVYLPVEVNTTQPQVIKGEQVKR